MIRVLLVDADAHSAAVASQLIFKEGCHAALVSSHEQAHSVAGTVRPHLVLIRVDQPDRAIIATISQIKASNPGLVLRFGCLSTQPDATSSHKFLHMGFDYVLKVPVEAQALQAVVASVKQHLST
jgi:DNA-binding response OmpR family regulator